ncbi:MAG: hypothetical protein DWQ36_18735 [Acidobacteria bacterium]|nr:MAG: hypothetical protein DWQ30_03705 [Acidobacteriota bacterium]REK03810.1 MAG: hypothetical protein DWQ36_18735 [Acidobacteriota bacterium]
MDPMQGPDCTSTRSAASLLRLAIVHRLPSPAPVRIAEYRSWLAGLRSADFRLALRTACRGLDPELDLLLEDSDARCVAA